MSVRSGQSVTADFTTSRFDTGSATVADSLPTGTLVVNGTDDAATVTVTSKTGGKYKAAVTLPTLAIGDVVQIRIAATVNSVAGVGVIWTDTKDVLIDANGKTTDAVQTGDNFAAIAALDTEIAAIKAATDNLPSDPADASVIAGLIAAIPSAATNAVATRTELATELARIDAAISSRSTYAGTDTSGTTTLLSRVTGAVMLASSYTAPPTAAQNRAEMDSNSTKLAAIVADTDELQTDWHNGGRLDLILDTAASGGGSVTIGEFGADALAQLAALDTINVRGAQVRNGVIDSLVVGRDYLTADGQQLQFVNPSGSWPNLTGATITLRLSSLTNDPVVIAGSVVTASGLNQRTDVSFSNAVTDTLSSDYRAYTLEAVLSTGNSVRLETGTVIVTE